MTHRPSASAASGDAPELQDWRRPCALCLSHAIGNMAAVVYRQGLNSCRYASSLPWFLILDGDGLSAGRNRTPLLWFGVSGIYLPKPELTATVLATRTSTLA